MIHLKIIGCVTNVRGQKSELRGGGSSAEVSSQSDEVEDLR